MKTYTGIKDSKGIKIYLGDYIRGFVHRSYGPIEIEGKIIFANGAFGVKDNCYSVDGVEHHKLIPLNDFIWEYGKDNTLESSCAFNGELI